MHPLDLLKIKFQVATSPPPGGVGRSIYYALRNIYATAGVPGLYRGVGTNIAGNASSWGLYFLFYTYLKERASGEDRKQLSPSTFLLCSAQASAATALLTNPIWVVKVRMFTTQAGTPGAYRSLWDGLSSIYRTEGRHGLWRGTWLALFGVSNGAIQFMAYEQMKKYGFAYKRKEFERLSKPWTTRDERLPNWAYTAMSGLSKVISLTSTYPYQVIRSRLQNNATAALYPNIRTAIKRTWAEERLAGFYRGLGTNLVRVLPGNCVTFVVYENLVWLFRTQAVRRHVSG